jgi:hypothetical protein
VVKSLRGLRRARRFKRSYIGFGEIFQAENLALAAF